MPTNYNGGCWGRCAFDWTAFSNHRVEIVFSRLCLTVSEHRAVRGLNSGEACPEESQERKES